MPNTRDNFNYIIALVPIYLCDSTGVNALNLSKLSA